MINSNEIDVNLPKLVLQKIDFGKDLLETLTPYEKLEGIQKLQRKINQELRFLKKIHKSDCIKKEHLQCSNLTHFSSLISTLHQVENCTSIVKPFNLNDRKIVIDIVCDRGLTWIKVVARNPKSINQICMGDSNYGVRSIIDQAREYLECAQLYPCLFQTPKVNFVFSNGIGSKLANTLEHMGVTVKGKRLIELDEDVHLETCHVSELTTKNTSHINKLNLDVSAMLAYCSSVTNGSCDKYEFSVPVLAQQAAWECLRPQKVILNQLFKDKKLYCCQTAKDNFVNIINTVGGPNEKIRGEELLSRLTVLPDNATVSDTEDGRNVNFNSIQFTPDKQLRVGGKIKERSFIIFLFGDRIQAITVTANDGFVRAAKQQGINFVVFVHESRALTEQKEQTRAKQITN